MQNENRLATKDTWSGAIRDRIKYKNSLAASRLGWTGIF
jgi:hypothetical protein